MNATAHVPYRPKSYVMAALSLALVLCADPSGVWAQGTGGTGGGGGSSGGGSLPPAPTPTQNAITWPTDFVVLSSTIEGAGVSLALPPAHVGGTFEWDNSIFPVSPTWVFDPDTMEFVIDTTMPYPKWEVTGAPPGIVIHDFPGANQFWGSVAEGAGSASGNGLGYTEYNMTLTLRDGAGIVPGEYSAGFSVYVSQRVDITTPGGTLATLEPYEAFSASIGTAGGYNNSGVSYVDLEFSSADLPSWLALSAATGTLVGMPTLSDVGVHTFTVQVTDVGWLQHHYNPPWSDGTIAAWSDFENYTIIVEVPELLITTPESLGDIALNEPFAATIEAGGGYGALTYSSDDLPEWLTLDPQTGALSGTPTTPEQVAEHTFHVTVTDECIPVNIVTAEFTVSVGTAALEYASGYTLPAAQVGTAYSFTLLATGGAGAYTWAATNLPAGLTISAAGVVSGVPLPGAMGSNAVFVSVHDEVTPPNVAATYISLFVQGPDEELLSIVTSSLPPATAGEAWGPVSLQASGGTGEYAWSAVGLPAGLTLSAATLSGTPAFGTGGLYHVNIVLTDLGLEAQTSAMLTLVISESADENDQTSISPGMAARRLIDGAKSGCMLSTGGERGASGMAMLAVLVLMAVSRFRAVPVKPAR
ncbi:MAG: putative Ig domain-containing protein [Planctomycetes bacterium]|nr:putative Ig domain-containing protein [Planctomycetota bacterium]NUQ34216.1 putative Ig domain-containing protein [Planctomycetaceae bacterium]